MNIFNKVALQGLIKSRTRTIVTIIGVILSAAMITGVAAFAVSLQTYMVKGAIAKYGSWQVGFLDVSSSFVQEQTEDNRVANAAAFENIGYAVLPEGKNPAKPYLFIAGFSKETFASMPIQLAAGRFPKNSKEVLVPEHVAANGGVKIDIGDTLTLMVGKRINGNENLGQHLPYQAGDSSGKNAETLAATIQKTYKVVGICERPAFEEYAAPGYTMITKEEEADQAGNYSVFVTLRKPGQVYSYAKHATGSPDFIFNDNVLRFMGLSNDTVFNALLYAVVGILVVLIMIGSIFLIYNSFTISLNERMRQFGILSSVGATEKQLRNSVLFEGLCIGAIGIPIGILVGIPSIQFVLSLVASKFGSILYDAVPLTLSVSLPAIAAAAAISMITILISAYIPAKKAAETPVMECIRQTNEVKVESKAMKTSKFTERVLGLEGTLALKNFKRNKRRYRSIVLSLTLSVVLFVSASAFGMHLKQAAGQSVVNIDYDICFYTQDMKEDELFQLYDKLKTASGVTESSYQAMTTVSCPVKTGAFTENYRELEGYDSSDPTIVLQLDLQFIEDQVFERFVEGLGLLTEEYMGDDAKMLAVAKVKSADRTKDGKSEITNLFTDSSMNVQITSETIPLTFVDVIPVDTLPRQSAKKKDYVFMVVAPYQLKEKYMGNYADHANAEMGLTFRSDNPAQTVAEMEKMIQSGGITAAYTLNHVYEILEENRNIIFIVDLFTYVFVFMISLIAIANVFNTISTNIKLRRRELAMLRSVGMSDRDFYRMMSFECVFYGMRTLLLGLPAAGICSWLIYKGLLAGGADLAFLFPAGSLGISVIGVFLVIFITMLYTISKISRENIIDALRDDMT